MESACFQGQESSISYCNMKTPELTILDIRVRNCPNSKGTVTLASYISRDRDRGGRKMKNALLISDKPRLCFDLKMNFTI